MSLGKRLKEAREKLNYSQIYVAKMLGITNAALSNYERDYRDPDTELLNRLAEFYGVSADWLLGRSRTSKQQPSQDPTRAELEDLLKKSNVHFNGAPLDEEDKEDLLEFIKLALKRKKGR
ncbi:MAG: helix-turn-helix domain-containing protein [Bacillota bacterium]